MEHVTDLLYTGRANSLIISSLLFHISYILLLKVFRILSTLYLFIVDINNIEGDVIYPELSHYGNLYGTVLSSTFWSCNMKKEETTLFLVSFKHLGVSSYV